MYAPPRATGRHGGSKRVSVGGSPADILPDANPYLEPGDALVLQVTEGENLRIVSVERVRPALD